MKNKISIKFDFAFFFILKWVDAQWDGCLPRQWVVAAHPGKSVRVGVPAGLWEASILLSQHKSPSWLAVLPYFPLQRTPWNTWFYLSHKPVQKKKNLTLALVILDSVSRAVLLATYQPPELAVHCPDLGSEENRAVFKLSQICTAKTPPHIALNPALTLLPHRRGRSVLPQGSDAAAQGFSPWLRCVRYSPEGCRRCLSVASLLLGGCHLPCQGMSWGRGRGRLGKPRWRGAVLVVEHWTFQLRGRERRAGHGELLSEGGIGKGLGWLLLRSSKRDWTLHSPCWGRSWWWPWLPRALLEVGESLCLSGLFQLLPRISLVLVLIFPAASSFLLSVSTPSIPLDFTHKFLYWLPFSALKQTSRVGHKGCCWQIESCLLFLSYTVLTSPN